MLEPEMTITSPFVPSVRRFVTPGGVFVVSHSQVKLPKKENIKRIVNVDAIITKAWLSIITLGAVGRVVIGIIIDLWGKKDELYLPGKTRETTRIKNSWSAFFKLAEPDL